MDIHGVEHDFAGEIEVSFAPGYCRLEFRRDGQPVMRLLLRREAAVALGSAIKKAAESNHDTVATIT